MIVVANNQHQRGSASRNTIITIDLGAETKSRMEKLRTDWGRDLTRVERRLNGEMGALRMQIEALELRTRPANMAAVGGNGK